MDWQYKFSTIAKETESNLARVKNRLVTPPTCYTASTTPKILNNGALASTMPNSHSEYIPLEQSPGIIALLQDRIDDQARAMDSLMQTVQHLQDERDRDRRTIQELRGEMHSITNRLAENGVSIQTERKLEQWRHQIAADMQALNSQLQSHRSRGDEGSALSFTNDLYESRKLIREECESFRRELDTIKSRLVKLELLVTSQDGECKELHRSQERIDRTMRDVLDVHQATSRDLNRTKESINKDKHDLSSLRSNYRNLKSQLGAIHSQITDTSSQRSYPRRRKRPSRNQHNRSLPDGLTSPTTSDLDFVHSPSLRSRSIHQMPTGPVSPPTSDLDLGLTDSDDFEESTDILPPPREYSERKDSGSEDDYLLSDLNLSTADLSSTDETLNLDDLK